MTTSFDIAIAVNDPLWECEVEHLRKYATHIVLTTLNHMQEHVYEFLKSVHKMPIGLAIVFSSDVEVRELNAQFRGKDSATNVLSFAADIEAPQPEGQEIILGDVILAYGVIAAEASEQGKTFKHHMTHMVVHGLLHLLGFDHITDAQAKVMEQHERDILVLFSISDPYANVELPKLQAL